MLGNESFERRFVVGLGNPGRDYAETRHNIGFRVVAALRGRWRLDAGRRAFSGRTWEARLQRAGTDRRVVLLEPYTFMNCSGRAVQEMMRFYKADFENLLVVLDDMALEFGRLRMRPEGSHGGHNGLADIIASLGSQSIPRLRIGIGNPPGRMEGRDFVLSRFRGQEVETIADAIERAADAVEDWLFSGSRYVMDHYNRKSDDE